MLTIAHRLTTIRRADNIVVLTDDGVAEQGTHEELLRRSGIPVYETVIRRTDKVDESTFAREAAHRYSKRCSAGQDYLRFVREFLEKEGKGNG